METNLNRNEVKTQETAIKEIFAELEKGIKFSEDMYDALTNWNNDYEDYNSFLKSIAKSVYNGENKIEDGIRLANNAIDKIREEKKEFFKSGVWKNEAEYVMIDRYTDALWWAWENWEDEDTKEFWGGDEKPARPTDEFRDFYADITDWEEEF